MPSCSITHWDLGYIGTKYYGQNRVPYDAWFSGKNAADGCSLAVAYKIEGVSKEIIYADFYVTALDQVGGILNVYPGEASTFIHIIGPLFAGSQKDFISEIIWYTPERICPRFDKVILTYRDNTQEEIPIRMLSSTRNGDFWRADRDKTNNGNNNGSSGGCYIATCVYGSYDCPQVWTLRRFRDYSLSKSWAGRSFIRFYYRISPMIVERFGKTEWFKLIMKPVLDRMVKYLQKKGYLSILYKD